MKVKVVLVGLSWWCISSLIVSLMLTVQCDAALDLDSVVGMWLLDDGNGKKVKDISGKGNDGKLMEAKWVDGKFDKALEFDGKTALVDCGMDDSLNIKQGTFGLWLNFGAAPADAGHLMNPLAKSDQYWIHASGDDSIQAKINVAGERYVAKTDPKFIKKGTWYHTFGIYDGATLKLYVNGEEKAKTKVKKGDLNINKAKILAIGTWSDKVDYFQGTIDEVVVTTQVLSRAEIGVIFNVGLLAVSPAGKLTIAWGSIKSR